MTREEQLFGMYPQLKPDNRPPKWLLLATLGAIVVGLLIITALANAEEIGTASWYSRASCLKESGQFIMANGKELNDEQFTVASWDFNFGDRLRVTNLCNGNVVVVKVTDRGPAKRLYKKGRILDLSVAAFKALAGEQGLKAGLLKVKVEKVK